MSQNQMVTMLNTIRSEMGEDYQASVPEATPYNLQAVGQPIIQYQNFGNQFLGALINRIAFSRVRNMVFENPLKELKKGSIPFGVDIEEIYSNPAIPRAYNDANSQNLFSVNKPDTKAAFFRMTRQDQTPVTISKPQLKLAFTSYNELESLLNSIINTLYSGDNIKEFMLSKALFTNAIGSDFITKIPVTQVTDESTTKALIKKVKEVSTLFKFPTDKYNKYSSLDGATGKPVVTWTPIEKQLILIDASMEATIDVDVLAAAFNISKVEFIPRMIVIDDLLQATNCYMLLFDEAFTQIWDNYYEMTEFWNAKTLTWNYYLNHWQTFQWSPFVNCVAFTYTAIPTITSVTLTPQTAHYTEGNYLDFFVDVQGTNSPNTGVTWEITGNSDQTTNISLNGNLYLGINENGTIVVTATSKEDITKSDRAIIMPNIPAPVVPPVGGE